ncbi:MAG: PAS domain S-box protein [Rhodoferax sp.]|nr:PAS domain S-box protein [Rhodoferax sp.]
MVTDAQATIIDVNDAFTRITGYSREVVLGQNPRMLQSGRQNKAFYAAMWDALKEQGSMEWGGVEPTQERRSICRASGRQRRARCAGPDPAVCGAVLRHHRHQGPPKPARTHCPL